MGGGAGRGKGGMGGRGSQVSPNLIRWSIWFGRTGGSGQHTLCGPAAEQIVSRSVSQSPPPPRVDPPQGGVRPRRTNTTFVCFLTEGDSSAPVSGCAGRAKGARGGGRDQQKSLWAHLLWRDRHLERTSNGRPEGLVGDDTVRNSIHAGRGGEVAQAGRISELETKTCLENRCW